MQRETDFVREAVFMNLRSGAFASRGGGTHTLVAQGRISAEVWIIFPPLGVIGGN